MFLWSPTSLSGQRADPTVAARNMDIVNHDIRALELKCIKLALDERRYHANRLLALLLLLSVINSDRVKEVVLSLIDSGVVHMSVFFYSVVLLWPTACTPPPKAL